MKNYEKPMILANEEMAEGVYAASGTTAAASDIVARLTQYDHYGNYYLNITGFDNASTYRVTVQVSETATVYGLTSASWGDFGGVVSGNTVTFENICFGNQTDWHVRLWFSSQGNWDYGWKLEDADIPSLTVSAVKIG